MKKIACIVLTLIMLLSMATMTAFAFDEFEPSHLFFAPAKGDTRPQNENCINYSAYVIAYEGELKNITSYIASKGEDEIQQECLGQYSNSSSYNMYHKRYRQYFFDCASFDKNSSSQFIFEGKTPVVVIFYSEDGNATEYCAITASQVSMKKGKIYFDDAEDCFSTGWYTFLEGSARNYNSFQQTVLFILRLFGANHIANFLSKLWRF